MALGIWPGSGFLGRAACWDNEAIQVRWEIDEI